ncbi:MAG: AmmeMemoRadiSam system protein B [Oscillospiraceae bacterium]|nr:AmmeMemoRadiSam system protein B [Oscillospiraceae bacterium]
MLQAAYVFPHPPIIIPEVGKGRESEIQSTINAFHECAEKIAQLQPETIVLITPHNVNFADYFHISPGESATGDLGRFDAANVSITANYDTQLVAEIVGSCAKSEIPAGTLGERVSDLDHGTIVPLYFVNKHYKNYNLVRIGLSGLSNAEHYKFGEVIRQSSERLNRKTVLIASGDLSHILPEPAGVKLDTEITGALANGDFERLLRIPPELSERGAECGLRSCIIMAGALSGLPVKAKLLSYEGTFGVGYAVAELICAERGC